MGNHHIGLKIGADHLALSYYKSFDLPVKIVRPFNTFGPRQSARAIIPTAITQILGGQKKLSLGNLNPTRDLTYVKDIVSGFLAIAEVNDLYGQVTNIGMNEEIKIEELMMLIAKSMDIEISIEKEDQRIRPEKSEVYRLKCDNSKILSNTKWTPKYTLTEGLSETIDWFKNKKELYKSELYNV